MINIIKEKLDLSPDLKKKIDWAKNYTFTPITLEKGHLIRLEPSIYLGLNSLRGQSLMLLFFLYYKKLEIMVGISP